MAGAPFKPSFGLGGVVDLALAPVCALVFRLKLFNQPSTLLGTDQAEQLCRVYRGTLSGDSLSALPISGLSGYLQRSAI